MLTIGIFVFYIIARPDMHKTIGLILICFAISTSFIISYINFDIKYSSYQELIGENHKIEAVVLSERYIGGNLSGYEVKVTNIDGKSHNCKAFLDCMYISDMQPGYVISADLEISEPQDNLNGYNQKQSMMSGGYFMLLTSTDENSYEIISENSSSPVVALKKLNSTLSYRIKNAVGGSGGSLCCALFLGNRSLLSDNIQKDFSRAGASHILALSGMHMSIIMGLLNFILTQIRVKKKVRAVLLSIIAIFYLALTGFSISATRSVIMLITVYIAALCSHQSDTLTSLFAAGSVIIFFSPGAVIDPGFWMSFAATMGLIVFMPLVSEMNIKIFKYTAKFKFFGKALSGFTELIFAGIFSIIPLLIVFCIFSGEIAIFSPLTSMVLAIPTSIVILFSLLFFVTFKLPLFNNLIISVLRLSSQLMIDFCQSVSQRENTVYSLKYSFTAIFIVIFAAALLISLLPRYKHKSLSLIPIITVISTFIITVIIHNSIYADRIQFTYISCSSNSDMIVISNQNEAIICDLSNGSKSSYFAAVDACKKSNVTEIKAIMITDYKTLHIPTLSKVFKENRVRQLWLVQPSDEDDYYRMLSILERAKENNVDVYTYNESMELYAFGSLNINVRTSYIDRSSLPVTVVRFKVGGRSLTYTSSAYPESDIYDIVNGYINESEYLIIGAVGPKPKTMYSPTLSDKSKHIIIPNYNIAGYLDTSNIPQDILITVNPERTTFYLYKNKIP